MAAVFGLLLAALAPAGARGEPQHLGLHFLDESLDVEALAYSTWNGFEWESDPTYHPVELTGADRQFVQDGGFAGWAEPDARAAITWEVERLFREVDTGDANMTLRVAVYAGPVPVDMPGRRLNAVIGHNETARSTALGKIPAPIDGPHYLDRTNWPDDSYTAAVLPVNIDGLSGLEFPTATAAINAVGGTAAHELGHLYDLGHVDAGDSPPYPVMATSGRGLDNEDRAEPRRFIDAHAAALVDAIGTVNRADFNMDGNVNIVQPGGGQSDLNILLSHVGMTQTALMRHGDADNDQDVDIVEFGGDGVSDFNILISNVTAAADFGDDAAGAGDVELVYDYKTGEVYLENAGGFEYVAFGSPGNVLPGGEDADGLNGAMAMYKDSDQVLYGGVAGNTTEDSVGLMLVTDLEAADIGVFGQNSGQDAVDGVVTVIPEPATMSLLALGGVAALIRRKRR
ncbi:MAG: PEP-CTERM sorting domain-containing protein [Planctomycetota bacterium]